MYRYFHQSDTKCLEEEESVGLHDCRAEQIALNEGVLSFYFPDGIYVGRNSGEGRKIFYTGEARVEFPLLDFIDASVTIYVYTKDKDRTIREEYTVEALMEEINHKGVRIEFIYSYIGYRTFKFDCWLWFDEEPYHKECELVISAEKVIYRWDNMYEES